MKFLTSLVLSLLPFTAFAAKKKASTDQFDNFHRKALSSTPVTLDDNSFTKLTSAPRNYSAAVLLTAIDNRFGCRLCQDFEPEWDLLARSWLKGDKEGNKRVVYATLDFLDGKQTFQALQLTTAPVLLLFQPTTGPDAKPNADPSRFDFSLGGQSAESIHAWIIRTLPSRSSPYPRFVRPINYVRIGAITTIALGAITAAFVAYPYVLPLLQNRNLWAGISLICILLFTSGHMFNQIRGTPYVSGDGKGGISYFAGGFQNQFGMESQIVAAMYGVLAISTVALATSVPRMKDPKSQQVAVFAWGAVMFGMYSFLMSVFRVKNGGYPFFLPPF